MENPLVSLDSDTTVSNSEGTSEAGTPPNMNTSSTSLSSDTQMVEKFSDDESKNVIDKLLVLPCLQEKRIGNESEQMGSIINNEGMKIRSVDSSYYNDLWSGDPDGTQYGDARKSLQFKVIDDFKDCKSTLTNTKWGIYAKSLLDEWNIYAKSLSDKSSLGQDKSSLGQDIVSLMVTHHNRMRGIPGDTVKEDNTETPGNLLGQSGGGMKKLFVRTKAFFNFNDSTEPLLPITEILGDDYCNSYANTFCLRIHYDKEKREVEFNVFFPGFPDKDISDQSANFHEASVEAQNRYDKHHGGGGYKYCHDIKNIQTSTIKTELEAVFNTKPHGDTKNVTIYLIRHGNSLHNQPIFRKEVDSSLTTLGIYQAHKLGQLLKNHPDFAGTNKTIILCSSFLSRAQLTALQILKTIKGQLPENLEHDYILLKKAALTRCPASVESFYEYAPLTQDLNKGHFKNFIEDLKKPTLNVSSNERGGKKRYIKKKTAKSKQKKNKKSKQKYRKSLKKK